MYPDAPLVGYLVHSNNIRWIKFTMMRAIRYGRLDIIKLLPTTIIDYKTLQLAASLGQTTILNYLLDHANTDITFNSKYLTMTTLHDALYEGDIDMMRLLIEHGEDINEKDRCGWTPIHIASWNGNVDAMQLLLEHKADINEVDRNKRTSLQKASTMGRVNAVRLLIKHNADINKKERYGWTPLRSAIYMGRTDVIRLLKSHGAIQ